MDFFLSDVRILIPSTSSVFVMCRSPDFLAYSLRGSYTLSLLSFALSAEEAAGRRKYLTHFTLAQTLKKFNFGGTWELKKKTYLTQDCLRTSYVP